MSGFEFLDPLFRDAEKDLLLLFSVFFALQAVYLVLNPVLIATGNRVWSLMATNLSLVLQVAVILVLWSDLSLQILASSMIVGQVGLVAVLVLGNMRAGKRT